MLDAVFEQPLLRVSPSPSLSGSGVRAPWQPLSSVRLLLSLLGDAQLSRSQCPSAACISSVLLALARSADTLTLASTAFSDTAAALDGGSSWKWSRLDECWGAMLRVCCCLAQQQQVGVAQHAHCDKLTASLDSLQPCHEQL